MKLATAVDIPGDRKPEYQKAKLLQQSDDLLPDIRRRFSVSRHGSLTGHARRVAGGSLSLVPSIIWTIATPIAWRNPDRKFPYGYHRSVRNINEAADAVARMDWRLAEFVPTRVPHLDDRDPKKRIGDEGR